MTKKKKFSYKDLKVNEEELAITKIGELADESKSPIFLFLVFGVLLIFVFFLPDVVKYIGKDDNAILVSPSNENKNESEEDNAENELTYYDFSTDLVVDLEENLQISNFKISTNTISFTITNKKDSKYYFSKKNYFLELYTEDRTLLERIIMSKEGIAKDNSKDFSYSINTNTATNTKKIVFVEKQVEDYPNVILSKNEADEEVLVCKKDYEEITYKFKEENLQSITDVINYMQGSNSLTYQNDLSLWQSRVTSYNNISGITSSFMSSANGFNVNTVLDLSNVKISEVDNENYYAYETLAKVVNFEMNARGFSCN